MPGQPAEQRARENIDRLLAQAGWTVCDLAQANIHASRGVAIREFPLKPDHGYANLKRAQALGQAVLRQQFTVRRE